VEVVRRVEKLLRRRPGEWEALHALGWRLRPLKRYVGLDEVGMLRVGCESGFWLVSNALQLSFYMQATRCQWEVNPAQSRVLGRSASTARRSASLLRCWGHRCSGADVDDVARVAVGDAAVGPTLHAVRCLDIQSQNAMQVR
jgi:glycine cleavage system aminomethyltransferase T